MSATGSAQMSPGNDEDVFADHIELALPAKPELLFLARMTAAAVASRAEFGYDQIDDLRLALDELCLTLLSGSPQPNSRVRLTFKWNESLIEVLAWLDGDDDSQAATTRLHASPRPNELSERILDALVDEHGFDVRDGQPSSSLRVRRREGDD